MGMDIYGKAPRSDAGKYFRNNVWWWHPLAFMIEELCPTEAAPCKSWHTNDGEGLNDEQAKALADKLDSLLQDGIVHEWVEKHKAQATLYSASVENVQEFSTFCRNSGGFEIL